MHPKSENLEAKPSLEDDPLFKVYDQVDGWRSFRASQILMISMNTVWK